MTSHLDREQVSSQNPAVRLLREIGWTYLPAGVAGREAGHSVSDQYRDATKMIHLNWLTECSA